LDGNIDGVDVFNNSEQSEFIPILLIGVYIARSASPEDEKNQIWFKRPYPFIGGVYQGPGKPTVEELIDSLLAELRRLDPLKDGPETIDRRCTCSLRCMRCDSPI
jgi:hypothetical protein